LRQEIPESEKNGEIAFGQWFPGIAKLPERAACAMLLGWPTTSAVEEFLEYVIRQLIEFPDEMVLTRLEAPKKVAFRLQLRQSDIGKVIGKHGHTIDAIRNLLSAAAARHGQRVTLQIVEEGEPERPV
jgi:predicted RNA-binding protein YlqC (UPF0109 family)